MLLDPLRLERREHLYRKKGKENWGLNDKERKKKERETFKDAITKDDKKITQKTYQS